MKEKTKKYLRNMGCAYLLAIAVFLFKLYRNNKTNEFYTMTPSSLISGNFSIYDDNINKIGHIKYEKNGDKLIVSVKGDEINGVREMLNEDYHYDSIDFENIPMTLEKYENEFYYFYDTGESVFIISLLRPWFISYSPLRKLSRKEIKPGKLKDRQVYMFLNVDYKKYNYALNNLHPTIQNHFTAEGGYGQLYRCFFIQDNEL